MDVALESAGGGATLHPADRTPQAASRPFGPIPRVAVAVYGFALAGAGLTLCILAKQLNAFGAAGVNALLLGVACVVLAFRAGRRPRDVGADTAESTDPRLAATRVVTELADLERQLDELTERCATFDVQWPDADQRSDRGAA